MLYISTTSAAPPQESVSAVQMEYLDSTLLQYNVKASTQYNPKTW